MISLPYSHDLSITVLTAAVIANEQYDDDKNRTHDKLHWGPSDKVRTVVHHVTMISHHCRVMWLT